MNFNLPASLNFTLSHEATTTAFYISLTLLGAVIIDLILKSFVKVPKHFDTRRARSYLAIIKNIITIVVYIIAIYIIFTLIKVDLTPLLASASIIGVVVSISARSIIEDFLNGLFLLSLDSIAIGDYVKIDDDPKDSFIAEGIVERIGIRTISIRSYVDDALYVIPNGKVKKFINLSRPKSSVQIDIALKADQEIDKILTCADKALQHLYDDDNFTNYILHESRVDGIDSFQTFGYMMLRVSIFTYPARRLEIARKYRYYIKKEFEKHKIKIG